MVVMVLNINSFHICKIFFLESSEIKCIRYTLFASQDLKRAPSAVLTAANSFGVPAGFQLSISIYYLRVVIMLGTHCTSIS